MKVRCVLLFSIRLGGMPACHHDVRTHGALLVRYIYFYTITSSNYESTLHEYVHEYVHAQIAFNTPPVRLRLGQVLPSGWARQMNRGAMHTEMDDKPLQWLHITRKWASKLHTGNT
jgi:hypothetical protein